MLKKPAGRAWNDWLYNEHPGFGRVLADLGGAARTIDTVFATGKTIGFERLAELPKLRRLSVRDVSQAQLEMIARLTRLSELRLFGFHGTDAGPLATLKKLEILSFEWAPKIETLDWLAALAGLRVLVIADLKRIQDLEAVGRLPRLQFLSVSGGSESVQTVASVAPLARLTKLEELQFIARVADEDLSPLAAMPWLKQLGLPDLYPVEAYAELAAYLPKTDCAAFAATRSYTIGKDRYVALTGKPSRQFKAGDPKSLAPIAKREAEFAHWLAHYTAKRKG